MIDVARKVGWTAMMAGALLIALYAAFALLLPGFGPPFIAERRTIMPWAVASHIAGGLIALALGAWQLNGRLRRRALNLHRWMGRGYAVAVAIGGLGALALAPFSQEGLVTHVGFGLLGFLWLATTMQAYLRIRAGGQRSHRRWMIRSYSLTLAAVSLRIYIPLSEAFGIPFADAYQVIAWLAWVPNLIMAEWFVLERRSGVEVASAK
ncbi:MAG: DUF2306 domain-containing protein [Gemmatimonadaceae bacterium]